jgi:flagellar hook protein FlgE
MLSSFFSAISGLKASSTAINNISNNIANVNTTGFKSTSITFEDALYQSINSSSGSEQVGRGTAISSITTDYADGSLETTSSSTDLAISGTGFFIVEDANTGTTYYTRAGSFDLDSDGNLVDTNGYAVQGKVIDSTTGTASGVDTDVIISQTPSQPNATDRLGMNVNLQSSSDWAGTVGAISGTGTSVSTVTATDGSYPATGTYTMTYDATAGTLTVTDGTTTYTETVAAGTTYEDFGGSGLTITTASTLAAGSQTVTLSGFDVTDASDTSNYSSSKTVYDSLGQSHAVTLCFSKTGEDSSGVSTWEWYAVVDAADSATGEDTIAGSGTLTFNSNGVLTSGGESQAVTFNFSNGAAQGQSIEIELGSGTNGGTTTQYSTSSTTNYSTQDGYPPGTLEGLSVDSAGIIYGSYSNGQTIALYEITLAKFNNPDGLEKEGSNLYSETVASGTAYTGAAGEGGLGDISSNSLEESNVDLSAEFVKLIIAQRAYQANSKVITTTSEVLDTLINLIR